MKFISLGSRSKDLTGKRFGLLVVNGPVGKRWGKIVWSCTCSCGHETRAVTGSLTSGNTSSCGCLQKERASTANKKQPLEYSVCDGIAHIFVKHKGKRVTVTIDAEDLERVIALRWYIHSCGYVAHKNGLHTVMLHRYVLGGVEKGLCVDHKNRDKLDNRKENLRIATASQNGANSLTKSLSGYKGVSRRKLKTKVVWRSRIKLNGKEIFIGNYESPMDAAIAYDKKAIELFGEYALTNSKLGRI